MEVHTSLSPLGPRLQHQVFVNFRGDELRYGFVSHLVEALQRHQINVFIDEFERKGADLTNLFVRIEESTIALVIFSRRYTESIWCLDELVKIKERSDQRFLEVVPIFFRVEPGTVKQLRGVFGDQFRDREWEHRSDKPRTDQWKEALASVSCKSGLTLAKKSKESKFVRTIVKEVEIMLQTTTMIPVLGRKSTGGGIEKEHSCMNVQASTLEPVDLSRKSILDLHKNSKIKNRIVVASNCNMDIEDENSVLRAQYIELSEKLQSLNSTMETVKGGVKEIPDSFINTRNMTSLTVNIFILILLFLLCYVFLYS